LRARGRAAWPLRTANGNEQTAKGTACAARERERWRGVRFPLPASTPYPYGTMPDFLRVLTRRALTSRDPALLQLAFETAVVERYRGQAAYQEIRTNTAGRVKKQGGWSVDFGIGAEDAFVHASWGQLAQNLPDDEREHWAAHVIGLALSENFLRMQLSPGSCFDDGDARAW
jgi:hypothetical protein